MKREEEEGPELPEPQELVITLIHELGTTKVRSFRPSELSQEGFVTLLKSIVDELSPPIEEPKLSWFDRLLIKFCKLSTGDSNEQS